MRDDLPAGTVTFLFTDVEGSTKLLHELGAEAYADALAEHRRVIREACASEGGVEVDTQGDAFFFAFPTAPGAVAAAEGMTDALAAGPIQVRIGLHTGTPLLRDERYIGDDVHFGARVASSGHGGQVIVSAATAELTEVELIDLGEHRLKDITEAVPIFQLGAGSFPPLKTISNTNLPRPASSFVGREAEVEAVLSRIEGGARLVTLTGSGGTGKTRLAIEAASELVSEFKAGVFWVGLATVRDPALVPETIAQTLGARDGLAEHIGEREMLLLLDNLEQVIDCAPELGSLLEACPNLCLLVTSRELLRISGEVEYAVPPLAEPEAVALFCARSRLEADEAITELCGRLDNLPLAVELAAARTSALTAEQILERLSQRLDLLKGGRDADPRQETLRATIEWSHELLSDEGQQLFARLSVFSGGCTLEAAEDVCDADIDTLQLLVEKSLMRFTEGRYWMLETIREFAGGKLEEAGEARESKQRHLDFTLRLASQVEAVLGSDPALRSRLDAEQDNLRAAIAWAEHVGDTHSQLDLVACTWPAWAYLGHLAEGSRWVESALVRSEGKRTGRRSRVLVAGAGFAHWQGDSERMKLYAEESLEITRDLGDTRGTAWSLIWLAESAGKSGSYEAATKLFEEATNVAREAGDRPLLAIAINNRGDVALRQKDHVLARSLFEEALVISRELGDQHGIAIETYNLALSLVYAGRLADASMAARESLELAHEVGSVIPIIDSFVLLASLASRQGNAYRGARYLGTAEALQDSFAPTLVSAEAELLEETVGELIEALGNERYAEAIAEGSALSLDDAVEDALKGVDA